MGRKRKNSLNSGGMNDLPYNQSNPFIVNSSEISRYFKEKEIRYVVRGSKVYDEESGEEKKLMIDKKIVVDTESFTKVFHTHIRDWFELSENASSLLGYIVRFLVKKDSDLFLLDYKEVSKDMGRRSNNWIFGAIYELSIKKIIARGGIKGVFYINPRFLFNGDRIKFIKRVVRGSKNVVSEPTIEIEE